jgi:hypothetical protein
MPDTRVAAPGLQVDVLDAPVTLSGQKRLEDQPARRGLLEAVVVQVLLENLELRERPGALDGPGSTEAGAAPMGGSDWSGISFTTSL